MSSSYTLQIIHFFNTNKQTRDTKNGGKKIKLTANRINRNVLGAVQSKPTSFLNCLIQFVSSEPCSHCCCPLPVSCYLHLRCFPPQLLLEPCHPDSAWQVTPPPLLLLQLGPGNPPERKVWAGEAPTAPSTMPHSTCNPAN